MDDMFMVNYLISQRVIAHTGYWIPGADETSPPANKSKIYLATGDIEFLSVLLSNTILG